MSHLVSTAHARTLSFSGTCINCAAHLSKGYKGYWGEIENRTKGTSGHAVECKPCFINHHSLTENLDPMTTQAPPMTLNLSATCWDKCEAVLPHVKRALLYGPPGTGKTYAALHNRPPGQVGYAITLTDETPMSELRGHYVRTSNGAYAWHDGPAMRAWKEGARLVVNEIHKASPDVEAFLHVILDDPESATLMLPTGDVATPHKAFSAVCTMNGDPRDLEEALLDRLVIKIDCDCIHPAAIKRLSPDLRDIAISQSLVEASRRISIRTWLEFDRLRNLINPGMAAVSIFGERAEELVSNLSVASVMDLLPSDKGAWKDFVADDTSKTGSPLDIFNSPLRDS